MVDMCVHKGYTYSIVLGAHRLPRDFVVKEITLYLYYPAKMLNYYHFDLYVTPI